MRNERSVSVEGLGGGSREITRCVDKDGAAIKKRGLSRGSETKMECVGGGKGMKAEGSRKGVRERRKRVEFGGERHKGVL